MRYKYIGEKASTTFRGVTFEKGKAVDLSSNPDLAQKVSVLDHFERVTLKPKKKREARKI